MGNKKIERVREDIRKTENKIREMEEYLKTLRLQEKQLEDEEIIKQIRSLNGKNGDVLDVLRMVQNMKSEPKESYEKESGDIEYGE